MTPNSTPPQAHPPRFPWLSWWITPIPVHFLTLAAAFLILSLYNHAMWTDVYRQSLGSNPHLWLFLLSLFAGLLLLLNAILTLFSWPYLFKAFLALVLVISASTSYFMDTFGVLIDRDMIRNIFQTDYQEAKDLISLTFLWHTALAGILPAWLLVLKPIRFGSGWRAVVQKSVIILTCLILVVAIVLPQYKQFSLFFRSHRYIRHMIVPVNVFGGLKSYLNRTLFAPSKALQRIGEDAVLGPLHAAASGRMLLVLVVGETARAANFSLQGYPRETSPRLKQAGGYYFSNFSSCGTSTAVSVPCSFSLQPRTNFRVEEADTTEGLLDVLRHAGIQVIWLDNNSGCKGTCYRGKFEDLSKTDNKALCNPEGCLDGVMIPRLREILTTETGPLAVVLHLKGSHGPAYFKRYPPAYRRFTPTCDREDVEQCDRETIVNTYDNTLLYTDAVLGDVVDLLKDQQGRFDSTMLYFSDHGESLGENGLYLHGMPYFMAPEYQTHVPMYTWFSPSFRTLMGIQPSCVSQRLNNPFSQDNIFHTVLGLMDVQTEVLDSKLDMFAPCRTPVAP